MAKVARISSVLSARYVVWGIALLLSMPPAIGQSVLLHLRNGDRLTGSLVSENSQQITLSNAILGRVVVPLAQIEHRELITPGAVAAAAPRTNAAPNPAALRDPVTQRRLQELLAAYLSGQISSESYHRQRAQLLAGAVGAQGQALAQTQPPAPKKPAAPPKHWSGEAQVGTDLGYGEKERQLYTGRLKLNYARGHVRNALDYQVIYGRTDGELSANRMDASMKTDYDLRRDYYLYSLAGGGYDEIRKIDLRYEVGPGLGYHLVRLTNFVLRLEGGFHYDVHEFQDQERKESFYHRLAQDMKWNLGTWISFDEKLEYLPQFDDFEEYKLRFEANLRVWLRSNLFLNLTVIELYDTVTAQGVGQNDLQVRSSIGMRF